MTKIEQLRKDFAHRLLKGPITTTPHTFLVLDEENKNYSLLKRKTSKSARNSCGNARDYQNSVQLMAFLRESGKSLNDPSISIRFDVGVTLDDLLPYLYGYGKFSTYRNFRTKGTPASRDSTVTIFQFEHQDSGLTYYAGRNDLITGRSTSRMLGPVKQGILKRLRRRDDWLHDTGAAILKNQGLDAWKVQVYDRLVPAEDSVSTVSELNREAHALNSAVLEAFYA